MTENNDASTNLQSTKEMLAHIIESFIELGVMVHDFQGTEAAREGLVAKVNQTISQFQEVNNISSRLTTFPISKEIIEYIEDGRNPDVYTREFVESTRKTNQFLRGEMIGMNLLRDSLAEKLKEEFPDLTEPVDDIIHRLEVDKKIVS